MDDAVFVALADPTRRQLLERLVMGPATATGIAVKFPVTRQAVVKHLGALEDAGMVAKERHGPAIRYQVLFYPVTDSSLSQESYEEFANGPWLTRAAMELFWDAYAPNKQDRRKTTAAPLSAIWITRMPSSSSGATTG